LLLLRVKTPAFQADSILIAVWLYCVAWNIDKEAIRAINVKGRVSRKIFEEFPHLKKRYWGKHSLVDVLLRMAA
jgi:hypothetical protein